MLCCLNISNAAELPEPLVNKLTQELQNTFDSKKPGATALIAINGKVVYRDAVGLADMELQVPMRSDMVFEIASITKQFTAVAILMLAEQGKLSLSDSVTRFIPDYPTQNKLITIHHLLTHTSGIRSYTDMPGLNLIMRDDYTPIELIDYFKNEPMDFLPGDKYRYNDSGYILLGRIIELISGNSYANFIESMIFKPLGMSDSYYASNSKVIPKRAKGYQHKDTVVNADYLSKTLPYAAGSLMSTVDDLYKWNRAIRSNTLISASSKAKAFTNHKLNNGENTNYGYGWEVSALNKSVKISHSGGIIGYVTNSIYLPEDDVFVAVFTNCNCLENEPVNVSNKMLGMVLTARDQQR